MEEERSTFSIINEKLRRPSSSSQNSTFESRYCPSPSTCDSGNFSNSELLLVPIGDEIINAEEKLELIVDENQKLILAHQIIRKLKSDLQCLSNSERWYRSELKAQKKSRLDTLEKLYLNERDFLKTNHILRLECQRLHVLYNQIKNKSKKEKETLLKQLKKYQDSDNSVVQENDIENKKYEYQKLNKILEEHEAVIDVLRKQKQNLLIDLRNLTSEKDGKMLVLERKAAALEKENCMMVEKCKDLILQNKKLNENESSLIITTNDKNENERLQSVVAMKKVEISNLKFELLKINKELKGFKFKFKYKNLEFEQLRSMYDSQHIELLQYKEICKNFSNHSTLESQNNEDLKKKEDEISVIKKELHSERYKTEKMQQNFLNINIKNEEIFNDFALLANKILDTSEIFLNQNLDDNNYSEMITEFRKDKNTFLLHYRQILKLCCDSIECFEQQLNTLREECNMRTAKYIESCKLLSSFEDIVKVLDKDVILAKIIYNENLHEDLILENFTFDIEETIRKNDALSNIFLHKLERPFINNLNMNKFFEHLKNCNSFIVNRGKVNYTQSQISSQLENEEQLPRNNEDLQNFNEISSAEASIPEDLNELKALLLSQQKENEKKITRRQAHVRMLISHIKSNKKKFENLNKKYEIMLNKTQISEKEIRDKEEIAYKLNVENCNLKGTIAVTKQKNQKCLDEIKNLECQLQIARKQFVEIDIYKKANAELKHNLRRLISDYKMIMNTQNNVYKSIKSNINYDKIYDLINKSNNCVPNLKNICQSVDNIKSDIKMLMQKNSISRCSENNLLAGNSVNDLLLYSYFTQGQRKSLMDELKEATTITTS